eukprot:m.34525 g.34525  ORF g.34525 m.34525 type:complete len:222 (-) comp16990_c0_seq1:342-1007(-)
MTTQAIPNAPRVIAFVACISLLMTAAFGQSQTDDCNVVDITTSEECSAKCGVSSIGGVNCGGSSQFQDSNGQLSCYCPICSGYMCGKTTPTCDPSSVKLTRNSVSPSQCVDPSSCDYLCSGAYLMTVTSSCAVTVVPTYDGSECSSCGIGTGTESGDTSSVSFPDSSTAVIAKTSSSSANVVAQVDGMTCTGVYSSSGASSIAASTMLMLAVVVVGQICNY